MSFREKSAWITLLSVLVCFGAYFGSIVTGQVSARGQDTLRLFLLCVHGLVLLQIVLHVIAVFTTPKDGRAMKDEREQVIQWRSHTLGYYVLVVALLTLVGPVHFGHPVPDLLNFVLLDVVIAVLTVCVAQVILFRRGA